MDGSVGLRSGNDALWGLTGPKRVPEADGVSRQLSRGGGASCLGGAGHLEAKEEVAGRDV